MAWTNRTGLSGQDKKRGLKGLLGIVMVRGDAAANAEHHRSVDLHQRRERRLIGASMKRSSSCPSVATCDSGGETASSCCCQKAFIRTFVTNCVVVEPPEPVTFPLIARGQPASYMIFPEFPKTFRGGRKTVELIDEGRLDPRLEDVSN